MNNSWEAIFKKYQIDTHNFEEQPFFITAEKEVYYFSKKGSLNILFGNWNLLI
jgi:hypothetical protein